VLKISKVKREEDVGMEAATWGHAQRFTALAVSLSLSLSLSVKVSEILHTEREVTAKWTKNGRRKEKSDNWEKKIGE
jgi:hypothetical protein